MQTAILFLVYGTLVEAGGVMGYVKSRSKASLIAGLVSGAFLYMAAALAFVGSGSGFYLGSAVTLALALLFAMRFGKTRKFMPAGLMLIVSVVVLAILFSLLPA